MEVDTTHRDIVHDSQFDYYGNLLATSSSDRTVNIFSVNTADGKHTHVQTLTGHEGPVWMVAWSHPSFSPVGTCTLATCSYDHSIIVWKNSASSPQAPPNFRPVHIMTHHKSSVNAICWGPYEYGVTLASAGSDGAVCVATLKDNVWGVAQVGEANRAHPMGAMGVSFAPKDDTNTTPNMILLGSGGCDCHVRVWLSRYEGGTPKNPVLAPFQCKFDFRDHDDWVRDVSFAPDAGSKYYTLASCGQDKRVVIRRILKTSTSLTDTSLSSATGWEISVTKFTDPVWRLSWSPCGTMLMVTTGNSECVILRAPLKFTDEWVSCIVQQGGGNVASPTSA